MPKYTHLTGLDRIRARQEAVDLYAQGATIRAVADRIGRSYHLTRKLLIEANVQLRERGGGIGRKTN